MIKLTCNHLEKAELTKCKHKQNESGSMCMASTIIGCISLAVGKGIFIDYGLEGE